MTAPGTWTRLHPGWAGFAGVCLFALLLRVPIAAIPLERNEGGYAYIGQHWLHGEIPYRDCFDIKPPGVFFVYAGILRIVGTSDVAIHWGMQLYTLGTLALIFALGRRLSSPTAGLAAAAFAAFMTTDPSVYGHSANAEIFMILPLTAAMLASCAAAERGTLGAAFLAGVCAGCAPLFKQVALSNVVFHALFVTWYMRRRPFAIAVFLLGVLVIPATTGVYFATHGAWGDFSDAVISHSAQYANQVPLSRYAEMSWRTLPYVLRAFWPVLLLAMAPTIAALIGPGAAAPSHDRRNTWWMVLWLCASIVGMASGGYFRQHWYVHSIPPVAVLAGMGVDRLLVAARRRNQQHAVSALLVSAAIGIGMLPGLWYYLPGDIGTKSARLYGSAPLTDILTVSDFIAAHSSPDDFVFVLGSEPEILYYAGRTSVTRYVFFYPLSGPFADARQRQRETLRDVRDKAPRLIVTVFLPGSFAAGPDMPMDIFDGTRALLDASYRIAAVLAFDGSVVKTQFVTGEAAERLWSEAPVWYGTTALWCELAIWERVETS